MKFLENTSEAIDVLYMNAKVMDDLVKEWVGQSFHITRGNRDISVDFDVLSSLFNLFNYQTIKFYHEPGNSTITLIDFARPVLTDTNTELYEIQLAEYTKLFSYFLFRWVMDKDLVEDKHLNIVYNHPDWNQRHLYYELSSSDINYSEIRAIYTRNNDIDYQRFRRILSQIDFEYIPNDLIHNIDIIHESLSVLSNKDIYVILDEKSIHSAVKTFTLGWQIYNFNAPLLLVYKDHLTYGVLVPVIFFKIRYSESV